MSDKTASAGRGEGLAGLVAKWRNGEDNWTIDRPGHSLAMQKCADELETEIAALEAAAPPSTAQRSKLELSIAEECLKPAIDLLNDAIWNYRETVTIKRGDLNYAVELAREALSLSSPIEPERCPDFRKMAKDFLHSEGGDGVDTLAAAFAMIDGNAAQRAQASSEVREARPPRTLGCTASDDCIHECPVSEPESRLDEFKTTVIALWDPEHTAEQKKAYIASRGKELREAAALASRQGAGGK